MSEELIIGRIWKEERGIKNNDPENFAEFDLIHKSYLKSIKKRCPCCNYARIRYRIEKGNYICVRCGSIFNDKKVIMKRERIACHNCLTVNRVRYRITEDDYYCDRCKIPVKEIDTSNKKTLYQKYLERKRKEWEERCQKY
jgi:DNA-directed RNA polymerase subunit RPC12/RpoP